MRIVSWNCNGAFRKKFKFIEEFEADIYIIQECENPEVTFHKEYREFANNYLWIGHKTKGLGIFAKDKTIELKNHEWKDFGLEWFICCRVNNQFNLLGVWGCRNYIEDVFVYFQIHKEKFTNIVIGGDFNSNTRWDKKHGRRTHSAFVSELEKLNLVSSYHVLENEIQGKESIPTFFLHRHQERKYHIDYFFCEQRINRHIQIGNFEKWINLSDHMPICLELDMN